MTERGRVLYEAINIFAKLTLDPRSGLVQVELFRVIFFAHTNVASPSNCRQVHEITLHGLKIRLHGIASFDLQAGNPVISIE